MGPTRLERLEAEAVLLKQAWTGLDGSIKELEEKLASLRELRGKAYRRWLNTEAAIEQAKEPITLEVD